MSGKVWFTRNNKIELRLDSNGKALDDHTVISRVQVDLGEGLFVIDSQANPEMFDIQTDRIILKFRTANTLAPPVLPGMYIAEIVVYSSDYLQGYTWVEDYQIEFE